MNSKQYAMSPCGTRLIVSTSRYSVANGDLSSRLTHANHMSFKTSSGNMTTVKSSHANVPAHFFHVPCLNPSLFDSSSESISCLISFGWLRRRVDRRGENWDLRGEKA